MIYKIIDMENYSLKACFVKTDAIPGGKAAERVRRVRRPA